jgi:L-asparagine transporter-like permease
VALTGREHVRKVATSVLLVSVMILGALLSVVGGAALGLVIVESEHSHSFSDYVSEYGWVALMGLGMLAGGLALTIISQRIAYARARSTWRTRVPTRLGYRAKSWKHYIIEEAKTNNH